ncbi:MAG: glycosyltransferase family 2 protein, partial [Clostridium sp.]
MENFIKFTITGVTGTLQILAFAVLMYYLIISLFGLYKKKHKDDGNMKEKSFALIVAAHNEEVVVEQIVESLKKLDYKKELYDIFVIADNCTDATAEIARNAGALVCERFDPDKRGKGYALEWMFGKIFEMEKKYDAVVVFDADNLASKNFLTAMSDKLNEGYKVVQGYLDSKNPHDSWITESYSIAFWSNNRLFQLARNNLGLSNQIGGTGFCIDTNTLRELGWGATCLTEDLEFTCKLVSNGHRVGWAHDAVIYDEKPLTLKQSWNQRKRWMQGFADVASRFFFKLLKKAFKERSWRAFDCALYTIQPYLTVLAGVCVILTGIQLLQPDGYIYV